MVTKLPKALGNTLCSKVPLHNLQIEARYIRSNNV